MVSKTDSEESELIENGESTSTTVSDVSIASQAFLTPKSKVSLLEKRIKLWKARYKTLLAHTRLKKQSPLEKLKFYRQLHKSKRRNSTENLIQFLESRYWKVKRVNHDLISNNRDLARSLAQQRMDSQEHYAESLNYQRELQTIQENIEMAVSSRLLALLGDITQPVVEKIDEGLASAQEQMSRLTSTRKMICALAEVVQQNGSATNVSYDDTDTSSDCLNAFGRKSSLSHKERYAETSNGGEETNGSLDGSSGKQLSSSRGSSNRQCKVMPMVMGHVLQQPKLALPKMDPQTLRAIARENREVARMENGFGMTIINEREMSDEDAGSVSEEEEDEGSSNELQHGAESTTRPVMNPLLQNTEIPGNYHRRLLANMTGSTNKGCLVPRVSINADCSAAATAALLSSQRPIDQTRRSKAHESLGSSSESDGGSSEQSLNDFQSRFPTLFSAECKSTSRQSVTAREGQEADVGDAVDLTYSPPPHQDLSLHSDSVCSSEDQDSSAPGGGRESKFISENGGVGQRSTNASSQEASREGFSAQTELSDSGTVGGNPKLTSGDEDPLEGPSWLYSPEATSASCSLNRKTRRYVTKAKSFTRQQSSKKACDNDLLKPPNGRGTASIALNSFESSNVHQSNWITKVNLPKLHVDRDSAVQDDIPTNIDSENNLGSGQPLHVPSRKSSAARRGRGRKSSVSFCDLVQVLEDETECKIQARRTRSQLSSFDAILAERYASVSASTDSTEQRSPRRDGLSHSRKSLKPQTKTDSRRSTGNNFRLILDESSNTDDHEDSPVGVRASSAEQTQNRIEGTLGDNSELDVENRSEICNLTALHLDGSAPSTPNRMRRRFEELEKMCPRRNRSRSKSGPAFSIHPENNDADALNEREKTVVLVDSPNSSSASASDSFSDLKEATVVLHRSLESPVDYRPKSSSKEREESSLPPSSSRLNTLPTRAKSAASGKSPSKREDISRLKKAPVNETCLEEELMEMTLTVPSSSSSDFLQSFKASKSNPNALKSVDDAAGNDGGSLITSTTVKSADNSSVKSSRKGKGKQKGKHFKAESRTRKAADNPTEFDFSQMEATVLNIPPYSSAKNSSSSMDEEETTGNSAKRLSIVLVDVCKTDDANVVEETMNVDQDDDSMPNLVARSKRSRNNEKNVGDFTNHLIEKNGSVSSTTKRNKKREVFPSVEGVTEHSIKKGDKRKSRSNPGLTLLGSSKRSRRNESISQDKSHSKNPSEVSSENTAVEGTSKCDSDESKLSSSIEDATSDASTEICSQISKKCVSEPSLCKHTDEGISDVLRSFEVSSESLSPQNKPMSSDESGKDGSPGKKLMLSASPTYGSTSVEMNDYAVSEPVFLDIRESNEPDPLEELDPERDPLGDLFPVIILSPPPKTGITIDVTVNGKVSERSPSGKKTNAMLTTPQQSVISSESAATSGSSEDAGSGGGGEAATGHPRRAASKSVSYVEPKLNSKLRQGDSLSTRACKGDGVFHTSKSGAKKAHKKRK